MERRHTIQKELVLETVRALRSHVTADEVYAAVSASHPSIGKGTVYRNLNILAEEGEIRRVGIPNGPDRFDFTLTEHHHICCVKCGRVSDVDMEIIPDLMSRVRDKHGMQFIDYDILFRGICPECQAEERNGSKVH